MDIKKLEDIINLPEGYYEHDGGITITVSPKDEEPFKGDLTTICALSEESFINVFKNISKKKCKQYCLNIEEIDNTEENIKAINRFLKHW